MPARPGPAIHRPLGQRSDLLSLGHAGRGAAGCASQSLVSQVAQRQADGLFVTGSRLFFWLQALINAFSERG
jgi:hypothetical protein